VFVTLAYHIVDDRIEHEIAVTERELESQLAHIRQEGYTVLTLTELLWIVSGETPAPDRGVFLTFDDGYADSLYAALPRLREYGVEATMFVPTAFVGGSDHWNAGPEHGLRFLDWHELERWLEGGGRIGGHTHGHETANEVGIDELRSSIEVNHRMLEQRLGIELAAFAYPNGVATPEARAEVARHYKAAWTMTGGTWFPRRDPFLLNRWGVARGLRLSKFAHQLDELFEARATGTRRQRRRTRTLPAAPRRARATNGAAPQGPRIALVVTGEDNPGYPTGRRFAHLLEAGWNVHLLHTGGPPDLYGLTDLPDEVLRHRIHPPPRELQRLRPRFDLVSGLVQSLLRRPVPVLAGLARRADPGVRYLRAVLLALDPEVVHLPSAAADGTSEVRSALAAGFVAERTGPANSAAADAVYVVDHPPDAAASNGLTGGRSVVIPRAVDPALLEWAPPNPGHVLHLLAIGPLAWTQGYEHLLHAVRLLTDRGVSCKCRIVGSGDYHDAISFACHQLDLGGVVELLVPGGRRELLHLRWADVLFNPTVEPTLPTWLDDAQAASRPVVTTELPDGRQEPTLLVPPGDADALAYAFEHLARDGEACRRLAGEGRRRALSFPPMSAQLEAFRDLYASVLQG